MWGLNVTYKFLICKIVLANLYCFIVKKNPGIYPWLFPSTDGEQIYTMYDLISYISCHFIWFLTYSLHTFCHHNLFLHEINMNFREIPVNFHLNSQ